MDYNTPTKLLPVEQLADGIGMDVTRLPEEYTKLIMPHATVYYHIDDDCVMVTQVIRLKEFSLWIHEVFALKDICLLPFTDVPVCILHFMQADSVAAYLNNNGVVALNTDEANVFKLIAEFHSALMHAGSYMLSFHVNILEENMPALLHKFPQLAFLQEKFQADMSQQLNAKPYAVNQVCKNIIRQILSCKYVGLRADHYLYKACERLFCNFATQEKLASLPALTYSERKAVKICHWLLDVRPDRDYSLRELSRRSHIPSHRINDVFKRAYGLPVDEFIEQHRMMMAYDHIMQKPLTLQKIARKTGFTDHYTMMQALNTYFQCDVGVLRDAQ